METLDLDESAKSRIFERRIMRRFLLEERGAPLPEKPQFAILGGQPGAGKTGVLDTTQREIRSRGATWTINADDFAGYFPGYRQLQQKHGAEAADMVRGVTGDWIKRTLAAAQQRGVNVVFESTMRQPEVVKRTLADFRSHGYETHAKALAVSPMVSWQGNHIRRESLALSGAPSRLATREAHDAGVRGSSATVAMIERERLADRVTVVSRSGDVLYSNEQRAGQWMKHAQGAEVLQAYRYKPLSKAEAKQHDANWGTVLELAGRRHARDGVSPANAAREIDAIRKDRANDAAATHLHRIEKQTGTTRAPVAKKDPDRG
ncbi:zeta toxin family protein [Xanthomonas axonopodis]|uniref:zeta toxin family protein n=1 Tax=Xanthomonas axonopodis TaxID=53413 RepID=UPI0035565EFF